MCEFCENVVTNDNWFDARLKGGDFIYRDNDGYGILIDTGDSGCLGNINNVNYCPMCGRDLRGKSENE